MPTVKRNNKIELNEEEIFKLILEKATLIKHAVIEKAQAMPKQGTVSMFRYGVAYGFIRGLLKTMRIPYTLIHPKTWKKEMMPDMGKDKGASILRVQQLFPTTELTRKKDHNIADAILLAEYGRRKFK